MIVRFWGVRGSSPTPLTPGELQNKISAVVQRIRPSHLLNSDTRQQFLSIIIPLENITCNNLSIHRCIIRTNITTQIGVNLHE